MGTEKNRQQNLLEAEYEHKLESLKNDYELQMEEMKMDRVILEVDSENKSIVIDGLCEELRKTGDAELSILADRVYVYSALQFGAEHEVREEVFNVMEVLDSLVSEKREEADLRGVKFRCLMKSIRDTKVILGRDLLAELLRILVSEALRCTEEGGSVLISGEQLETKEEGMLSYCFTVKDTGKADFPESEHRFFSPFGDMRGEMTTSSRLEMAIAERLTQLLQADMTLAASEDTKSISVTVTGRRP